MFEAKWARLRQQRRRHPLANGIEEEATAANTKLLQKQLTAAEGRIRKLRARVQSLEDEREELITKANNNTDILESKINHIERENERLKREAHPDYHTIANLFVALCNELQGLPASRPVVLKLTVEELALYLGLELGGRTPRL